MKKLTYIRAHFVASIAGAIAGIVTAQCFMGLHLAPMRMVMAVLFAPLLAPVSVILVLVTTILRRSAPQAHFAAMGATYLLAMALIVILARKHSSRGQRDL